MVNISAFLRLFTVSFKKSYSFLLLYRLFLYLTYHVQDRVFEIERDGQEEGSDEEVERRNGKITQLTDWFGHSLWIHA